MTSGTLQATEQQNRTLLCRPNFKDASCFYDWKNIYNSGKT